MHDKLGIRSTDAYTDAVKMMGTIMKYANLVLWGVAGSVDTLTAYPT